jgi:hypothetical protein
MLSVSWGKQLPVLLGDDFDGAVDHFYGGLIVNRVRRRADNLWRAFDKMRLERVGMNLDNRAG